MRDVFGDRVVEAFVADETSGADGLCCVARFADLEEELDVWVLDAERVPVPRRDAAGQVVEESVELGLGHHRPWRLPPAGCDGDTDCRGAGSPLRTRCASWQRRIWRRRSPGRVPRLPRLPTLGSRAPAGGVE